MTAGISLGGMQKMLAYADMALKDAKKKALAMEIYQGKELESKHKEDIRCYQTLLDALEHHRLVPYLQPIVPLQNPDLPLKYESLARLIDKKGNIIPPVNFLRVAKQNRIYYKITEAILSETLTLVEKHKLNISINISMMDITNTKTTSMIYKKLENFSFCEYLTFELLETEDFEDYDSVYTFCIKAKSFGVSLALDDFGSGYSNFFMLTKMKVDYIKIDGSLISSIDQHYSSWLVVESIVEFAKKLKVRTIAEYVYSSTIFSKVKELGIEYSQGFYIDKPRIDIKETML